MKTKPILFSAPMVRALLDGSKTQTRRAYKTKNGGVWPNVNDLPGMRQILRNCPYGQPGDQLWVREAWLKTNPWSEVGLHTYGYRASDAAEFPEAIWKPSIHMPRGASRITLEIIEVRVERLQDISESDCIAEGVMRGRDGMWCGAAHKIKGTPRAFHTAVGAYDDLWTSINGADSWASNPWVWVLTFKRIGETE